MVVPLNHVFGPQNIFYGNQWQVDAVDRHVNRTLLTHYQSFPRDPAYPRVALDIGCDDGRRALSLHELGIFDQIIACDLTDRMGEIDLRNHTALKGLSVDETIPPPIVFLKVKAQELDPGLFEGMNVACVNFRRVGQFLAPQDFRASLENIKNIAADKAHTVVSFDGVHRDEFRDCEEITATLPAFYDDPDRLAKKCAPYTRYANDSVTDYMRELGFVISNNRIEGPKKDFRTGECNIVAMAPGNARAYPLRPARRRNLLNRFGHPVAIAA